MSKRLTKQLGHALEDDIDALDVRNKSNNRQNPCFREVLVYPALLMPPIQR
jgi:hypothetical protein